jgi:hypothetical protein
MAIAESVIVADEQFAVIGTDSVVTLRIYSPTVRSNDKIACTFELGLDGAYESLDIYGASPMQAILLTFGYVADKIDDFLQQRGGYIDSVIWTDLRRLRSSEEELQAARSALAREWNLK